MTCIPRVPSIRIADFPRELFDHGESQIMAGGALEVIPVAAKADLSSIELCL